MIHDLLYFGYDWDENALDNLKEQKEFIEEIKEKFPDVKLEDAYDSIKGYRQQVFIEEKHNNNYFSWLIGKGWFEASLTIQIMMMSASEKPKEKKKFDKYFALAKKQYPEEFKPEVLK